MRFTPLGATDTVTGSCHLLEHDDYQLLLECGLYQGAEEERNVHRFGFDPRGLDAVVLSHAHLDHIGRAPRLVREGYRGPIFATGSTLRIAPVMLQDALEVMTEQRMRALRRGDPLPEQLWTGGDLRRFRKLGERVDYGEPLRLGPFTVTLHDAGHVAGSAFVEVEAGGRRLVFSGDLGNKSKIVLPDPEPAPPADLVVCESTYGDRPHRPFPESLDELAQVAREVLGKGGRLLIPSFALERTQELLFHLRQLELEGRIPRVPVYLDSPLAIEVTQVYRHLYDDFSPEVQAVFDGHDHPFTPYDFRPSLTVEESKAINRQSGPMIIVAGSGMLHGGRILHHLRNHLNDPRTCLVIFSYQPRGGLGRRLVDGTRQVTIMGHQVRVNARIETINGFSAHAGQDEILQWLEGQKRVMLVHGEPENSQVLAGLLAERGVDVVPTERGKAVEV